MAPRRHRSNSNVHNARNVATPLPPQRTITPSASAHKPGLSEAIYQTNLKVMLRREPSITGTVDQFPHVCIYRYDGNKWEKYGYEGSMFIYQKYVCCSHSRVLRADVSVQGYLSNLWVLRFESHGH